MYTRVLSVSSPTVRTNRLTILVPGEGCKDADRMQMKLHSYVWHTCTYLHMLAQKWTAALTITASLKLTMMTTRAISFEDGYE